MRKQFCHRIQAFAFVDLVEDLLDAAGVVLSLDLDLGGIAQEPRAELADVVGVGGREQQRLALGGTVRGNGDDVVVKAHVHHPVRFVQDQRVQARQVQAGARQMVLDAAGRAHDQMRAAGERFGLWTSRGAAAQRQDLDVGNQTRQPAQLLRDLVGQFAGGANHQSLRDQAVHVQVLEHAQSERGGLAAAGLGLGDHVAPFKNQRQGLRLDRRHLLETQGFQVFEQGRQEGEGGEGGVGHGGGGSERQLG